MFIKVFVYFFLTLPNPMHSVSREGNVDGILLLKYKFETEHLFSITNMYNSRSSVDLE